jgi:hypothetical protein
MYAAKCRATATDCTYPGRKPTNQNCTNEEVKDKLNSMNACCRTVQKVPSSRLLSKNVKIKIYKTIILPLMFLGVWNLGLHVKGRTD